MTPHIQAGAGDYADVVLLPGDPMRSEWMAQTMLDDARCVNTIRGALGYTGTYRGRAVSIQSSGMGQGSFSIYANELIRFYGVTTLLRVGSCGSLREDVRLRELVASEVAATDILADGLSFGSFETGARPDPGLLWQAQVCARALGVALHVGPTGASDHYYHPLGLGRLSALVEAGAIAIDMETHALYTIAGRHGARALSLCTVVDSLLTLEEIDHSERQGVFGNMARVALDVVATLSPAVARA